MANFRMTHLVGTTLADGRSEKLLARPSTMTR